MELPRLNQSPVVFNEADHTYFLNGKQLNGVTSTLVKRAYPDTYSIPEGFTQEQWEETLNQAAIKGTAMHQAIELYEDLGVKNDMPELQNYIAIKEDNCFVNLATEYIVSDEENYASAIDHVWYNPNTKEIVLVDLKRTFEIHEPEVTCQTSIYKKFFLRQNPHLKDYSICIALLWLRGAKSEFRMLKPLADEVLDSLIECDIHDAPFNIQETYGNLPAKFADAEEQIATLYQELKEKKALYDELTSGLFELMNKYGVKSFTGSRIQLTVSTGYKKEGFNKEAFVRDHADLYKEYKTSTDVKPSLRITVKKQ